MAVGIAASEVGIDTMAEGIDVAATDPRDSTRARASLFSSRARERGEGGVTGVEEGSRLLSWSRGLIDNGLMNPSMGLWDMVLVRSFFLEAAISERRLVMLSQPCSSEWCGRTATGGSMKEVLAIVRPCGRVEPSLWATGGLAAGAPGAHGGGRWASTVRWRRRFYERNFASDGEGIRLG
uniref:Uncharacterized protein n=2 Tax=Oryza TaxID=4527 RepID=A0A0D3GP70_9ORYZ